MPHYKVDMKIEEKNESHLSVGENGIEDETIPKHLSNGKFKLLQ